MRRKTQSVAVVLLVLVAACTSEISRKDPGIKKRKGKMYYQGSLYTGLVMHHYSTDALRYRAEYKNGQKEGVTQVYFETGIISDEWLYKDGKKTGSHRGWFKGGQKRYIKNYADGKSHGESWEWYPSGKIAGYKKYQAGELLVEKKWQRNGKVFLNYVRKDGKRYGLFGGKLCGKSKTTPKTLAGVSL